ncbi:unnamed protein product [Leuciscus chuanchicus]
MRTEYVQRVMELDADDDHHKFIYLDEAGFNLAKTRRSGRNFIGQRATIQVPGQRGANITMCAAISEDGVVGRRPHIGPYNAALLVTFLDELDQAPIVRLRGLIFLCLLHLCVQGVQDDVNPNVLAKMTQYLYDNVEPKTKQKTDAHCTIAINLPVDQCTDEGSDIQTVFSNSPMDKHLEKAEEGWSSVRIKSIFFLFLITPASLQTHTTSLNLLI